MVYFMIVFWAVIGWWILKCVAEMPEDTDTATDAIIALVVIDVLL